MIGPALMLLLAVGIVTALAWPPKLVAEFWRKPVSKEVISARPVGGRFGSEWVITFRWSDGNQYTARGDCTVWNYFPGGTRCPSDVEEWLCDRWTALRWARENAR